MAAARPDEAVRLLRQPLSYTGMHYSLQRAALLAMAYSREGQFREAHGVLSMIDERHLLPDEVMLLRCAWARLFIEAGNPAEARRRLAGVEDDDCDRDTACLLVKSWVALTLGELEAARACLEQGLDQNPTDEQRVLYLNNLASVEGAQGRPATQLERLKAARTVLQQAPRADLTAILHHNLAIALVRAGKPDEAREVLREAWAAGDPENLRHVLEVLNNSLLAARETGDASWRRAVYEEFDRHMARCGPISPREQLALDVSELKMRRNDGIPLRSGNYEGLIEHLLRDLERLPMGIPTGERIAALREIRYDLAREIETRPATANITKLDNIKLVELANRVTASLLKYRDAVDAYLQMLSPKLIFAVVTWRSYQTDMDKATFDLAANQEARHRALDQLFAHLHEKAEWLNGQGVAGAVIEAWIVLCDEYVAFHDQLPESERAAFRRDYRHRAEQALDQATCLLEQQPRLRDHANHLIGVAYFSLRLRDDEAAAARWVSMLAPLKPALDQYACWLREQYTWVLWRLGQGMQSVPAPATPL